MDISESDNDHIVTTVLTMTIYCKKGLAELLNVCRYFHLEIKNKIPYPMYAV